MTKKTEDLLAIAFAVAATLSVGVGVIGSLLPADRAAQVAAVAAPELSTGALLALSESPSH